MKMQKIFLSGFVLFSLFSCHAQNSNRLLTEKVAQAEQLLYQHPNDQHNWQQLYILINENYTKFSVAERTRLRNLLEKKAKWPVGTLYTATEPGIKIIIKGHIINTKGAPVVNATIHIFQTDSHGYYTPFDSTMKKMGESDARLFGFLQTDRTGYFEIKTIRPASYPLQYKGKTIPQHIHINVTAPGYTNRNIQMVFDDDPAMNDYWREWANKNNFPILKLNNATAGRTGTLEIIITQ